MRFLYSAFLLLLSITLAVCMDAAERQKMLRIASDCKISTKASDDDLAKLMLHIAPSSQEGKCLFKCITEKLEVIQGGKLSRKGLEPIAKAVGATDEIIEKVLAKCSMVTDSDECVTAVKLGICLKEGSKENNINFQL